MAILATHAVTFSLVLLLRNNSTFLTVVFVAASEWADGHASAHGSCSGQAHMMRSTKLCPPARVADAVLLVLFGETLNSLAAQHWESFAGQPYFDSNGAFFTAVVSGPLMIILFLILVRKSAA